MINALRRSYLFYSSVVFFGLFILLIPFFSLAILFNLPTFAVSLNRYWGKLFYTLIGITTVVENKHYLDKKGTYIFCPNHFSFLDITLMPILPVPFKFVGKVSITNIPVFGYFYKKFHITVDREKLKDRYATYQKSVEALRKGYSLTIFPEGGIHASHSTIMGRFKEGPFRMAIETGACLVPITLADNWYILPDDGKFLMFWKRKNRLIIHEPIDPSNYSLSGIKDFQSHVRNQIQQELDRLNA
ncbi:1-acyl-sn-glycerol-3-phosphate acyltransferase [Reichenbachiella faecimaris]|uniref:1-acyl-sn-glycerol-3-phosphate acyltransferase n=1 Tax=Reichenbachiella faecimaris TaxID=692418 RepID=A0A1W2GMS6_REIFA|nr:lysophospholipid acyltransferase family protein [Reichenbachiella faecimaris]SMD37864.1 1-acyl-sn-glycerol-3-phosphate acyltransferase [Reichenbachiella faecimaris]